MEALKNLDSKVIKPPNQSKQISRDEAIEMINKRAS
jgi:hypothetical protein